MSLFSLVGTLQGVLFVICVYRLLFAYVTKMPHCRGLDGASCQPLWSPSTSELSYICKQRSFYLLIFCILCTVLRSVWGHVTYFLYALHTQDWSLTCEQSVSSTPLGHSPTRCGKWTTRAPTTSASPVQACTSSSQAIIGNRLPTRRICKALSNNSASCDLGKLVLRSQSRRLRKELDSPWSAQLSSPAE